jgi:uncharacterized protein (TIGR02246 family)
LYFNGNKAIKCKEVMMKNILISLFVASLLVSCVQQHKAPDTEGDIAEIQALYKGYFKSAEAGDLDKFISFFDDNAIRSEPGMQAIIGKEAIKERFGVLFSVADNSLTLIGDRIIEVCGDMAYGYNEVTLTSKPKDGSPVIKTDMKVLTILKRQDDGSWKIYIDSFNYHPTWTQDTISSDILEEGNPYY